MRKKRFIQLILHNRPEIKNKNRGKFRLNEFISNLNIQEVNLTNDHFYFILFKIEIEYLSNQDINIRIYREKYNKQSFNCIFEMSALLC